MSACMCDYDYPTVHQSKRIIARKDHNCDECARGIRKGERYEKVDALFDGKWEHYKTCVYCLAVRDLMADSMDCFCWHHEGLWENIADEFDYGEPRPGLRFAVGRLVVERNHELLGLRNQNHG